jgi:hypothetical protein
MIRKVLFMTLTKADLIAAIAEQNGYPKNKSTETTVLQP